MAPPKRSEKPRTRITTVAFPLDLYLAVRNHAADLMRDGEQASIGAAVRDLTYRGLRAKGEGDPPPADPPPAA